MVCKKCQQPINNANEAAKCAKCPNEFHPACCRIRTLAKLNAMVAGGTSSSWKCDDCFETKPSAQTNVSDSATVMSMLKTIQSQMEANMKTIHDQMEVNKKESNDNFASLQSTLATLKVSFDGLEKKLTRVESDNLELKSRCGKLEETNLKLTKEIRDLKWVNMESEQYSKLRNIEIQGIPETEGENIYNILGSIAKTLKVTYQPGEISIAHRLAPSRNSFPTTIVASFVRRSVRAEWLKAARTNKIKASDVMASFGETPVYVNEHLTKHNKDLLKQAKNSVKTGDEKYAWVREGKVYVRKTADARARRLYWTLDDQPTQNAASAASASASSQ